MSEKILQKNCPKCNSLMRSPVLEDEFFEMNVRVFKTVICTECGSFRQQIAKCAQLKIEAWELLNRLTQKHNRITKSIETKTNKKDAHARLAKIKGEIPEVRSTISMLEAKEESLLSQRAMHEQQEKEHGDTELF